MQQLARLVAARAHLDVLKARHERVLWHGFDQ